MPTRLRKLVIDEVSLADRGANKSAVVLLMKRDAPTHQQEIDMLKIDVGALAMEALNGLAAQLRKREPHLTEAQAFAKAYQDPGNVELAKAERRGSVAKLYGTASTLARTEPKVLGSEAGPDSTAYGKLQELADEVRRASPFLSPEQAFARIYSDPMNAPLVQRERQAAYDRMTRSGGVTVF